MILDDENAIPDGMDMIPNINAFVPVDQPARPREYVRPEYPELSRRMEYTGTAYVKMLIDLDGSVMKVVLIKSSDFPELDSAAVEAAYKWTFTPAQLQGKPVRVWVAAPIKFELE
jgi:TonB family protein